MPDNFRHAQYRADGTQIDDPQKLSDPLTTETSWNLIPAGSAEDAIAQTLGIQAAINNGGIVKLNGYPGTVYETAGTLAIGSHTELHVAPGVIIRQRAGVRSQMIVTKSYLATPEAVTLSWSSGKTVTVTKVAHGKSIGDHVCIDNPTAVTTEQSKYKGTVRIESVPTPDTYTYSTRLRPSTAPTTGFVVRDAVVGAFVIGGIWDYNATNNPGLAGEEQRRLCMISAFTAFCGFRPTELRDLLKYGICSCMDLGSIHGDVRSNSFNATGGDLIKVYGPAYGTIARNLYGRTGDDMCSIQTKEPPVFINYMPAFGDCIGCRLENVNGTGENAGSTSGAIMYGSPNENMVNCWIDGLHGVFSGQAARIQGGDTLAAVILTAKVRNITAQAPNAVIVGGGGGGSTLRFGHIDLSEIVQNPSTATSDCISIGANATGDMLSIPTFAAVFDSVTTPTWPTGSAAVCIAVSGTVDQINVSDTTMIGVAANARFMQLAANASVRTINVIGSKLEGNQGINIISPQARVPTITFTGCDLDLAYGVNAAASVNVTAVGNTLVLDSGEALVRQTGGTVNLAHGGNTIIGIGTLTTGTVTATAW